jgi:hypothetical protein
MSKKTFKFMNDAGEEVSREEATRFIVAEYDNEGNLVRESWGIVRNPKGRRASRSGGQA